MKRSLRILLVSVMALSYVLNCAAEIKTDTETELLVEMAQQYQTLINQKQQLSLAIRQTNSEYKQILSLKVDKEQKIDRLSLEIDGEKALLKEIADDKQLFQAKAQAVAQKNSHVDASLVDRRITRDQEQRRYNKANINFFVAKDIFERALLDCQRYSELSKNCMNDERVNALRANMKVKANELKAAKMHLDQSQRLVDQSKYQQKSKDNTVEVFEMGVEELIHLELKHLDQLDFLSESMTNITAQKNNLTTLEKSLKSDLDKLSLELEKVENSLRSINPSIANL